MHSQGHHAEGKCKNKISGLLLKYAPIDKQYNYAQMAQIFPDWEISASKQWPLDAFKQIIGLSNWYFIIVMDIIILEHKPLQITNWHNISTNIVDGNTRIQKGRVGDQQLFWTLSNRLPTIIWQLTIKRK